MKDKCMEGQKWVFSVLSFWLIHFSSKIPLNGSNIKLMQVLGEKVVNFS